MLQIHHRLSSVGETIRKQANRVSVQIDGSFNALTLILSNLARQAECSRILRPFLSTLTLTPYARTHAHTRLAAYRT